MLFPIYLKKLQTQEHEVTSLGVLNPRPTDLVKRCSLALAALPTTLFLF